MHETYNKLKFYDYHITAGYYSKKDERILEKTLSISYNLVRKVIYQFP